MAISHGAGTFRRAKLGLGRAGELYKESSTFRYNDRYEEWIRREQAGAGGGGIDFVNASRSSDALWQNFDFVDGISYHIVVEDMSFEDGRPVRDCSGYANVTNTFLQGLQQEYPTIAIGTLRADVELTDLRDLALRGVPILLLDTFDLSTVVCPLARGVPCTNFQPRPKLRVRRGLHWAKSTPTHKDSTILAPVTDPAIDPAETNFDGGPFQQKSFPGQIQTIDGDEAVVLWDNGNTGRYSIAEGAQELAVLLSRDDLEVRNTDEELVLAQLHGSEHHSSGKGQEREKFCQQLETELGWSLDSRVTTERRGPAWNTKPGQSFAPCLTDIAALNRAVHNYGKGSIEAKAFGEFSLHQVIAARSAEKHESGETGGVSSQLDLAGEAAQWYMMRTKKVCQSMARHNTLWGESAEEISEIHRKEWNNNGLWSATRQLISAPAVRTASIHDRDYCQRQMWDMARIDRLPTYNSLQALVILRALWDTVDLFAHEAIRNKRIATECHTSFCLYSGSSPQLLPH
jgi:hypothetical protein